MNRLLLAAALALGIAGTAGAEPVTYRMDPNHTQVAVNWHHFGFSNPVILFGGGEGTIVYDAEDIGASSVEVSIPLSGMDSGVDAFDEHLRSADFFDAAQYPTITFDSTRVEAAGEGKLRVTGDLTVHGVTRPAVLEVDVNQVGRHPMSGLPSAGFDATTTIKRSDFGVGMYVPNVADEVELRITTEAMVPGAGQAEAADAG